MLLITIEVSYQKNYFIKLILILSGNKLELKETMFPITLQIRLYGLKDLKSSFHIAAFYIAYCRFETSLNSSNKNVLKFWQSFTCLPRRDKFLCWYVALKKAIRASSKHCRTLLHCLTSA